MKKRFILFITIFFAFIFFVLSSLTTIVNANEANYNFGNITEEESIQFVQNHDIDIPDYLENSSNLGEITKELIQLVYNDPNYLFIFNYNKMQDFANAIKAAVN